jgi:hypothetical protein
MTDDVPDDAAPLCNGELYREGCEGPKQMGKGQPRLFTGKFGKKTNKNSAKERLAQVRRLNQRPLDVRRMCRRDAPPPAMAGLRHVPVVSDRVIVQPLNHDDAPPEQKRVLQLAMQLLPTITARPPDSLPIAERSTNWANEFWELLSRNGKPLKRGLFGGQYEAMCSLQSSVLELGRTLTSRSDELRSPGSVARLFLTRVTAGGFDRMEMHQDPDGISMVLVLSTHFEGGHLSIANSSRGECRFTGSEPLQSKVKCASYQAVPLRQGDVCFFMGNTDHFVAPIAKGQRCALVAFMPHGSRR